MPFRADELQEERSLCMDEHFKACDGTIAMVIQVYSRLGTQPACHFIASAPWRGLLDITCPLRIRLHFSRNLLSTQKKLPPVAASNFADEALLPLFFTSISISYACGVLMNTSISCLQCRNVSNFFCFISRNKLFRTQSGW